jgi:hypothetical protein
MIRKIVLSALLGLAVVSANAFTLSVTIPPLTITNFFPITQGSAYIYQAIITAPTNIAQVAFYDTPTNSLVFTNASYTSRAWYATNYVNTWTNFYGTVQSTTNIALIDYTNTVPITTNSYPNRFTISSTSGGSAAFPNINSYFSSGIWATNFSTNTAIVTIVGRNGE